MVDIFSVTSWASYVGTVYIRLRHFSLPFYLILYCKYLSTYRRYRSGAKYPQQYIIGTYIGFFNDFTVTK